MSEHINNKTSENLQTICFELLIMASCDVDSSQEIDNDMFGDCLKNNITDVALCESSGVQNCSICKWDEYNIELDISYVILS